MSDLFTEQPEEPMTALATVPERQVTQLTPMAAILAAIDKGISPAEMGELYALQRQWETDEARKAYARAMTAAQGEMRPVVRSRTNAQQGSKYAALEDIHDVIKPIWLAHGFTLSYGSEHSPYPDHYRVACDCLHEGGHVTHHVIDGPADDHGIKGNANKTPIQGVTSTVTYLRRSLAIMIFDVTLVNADRDGQRAVPLITEEQVITLQENIDGRSINVPAFMKWLGIERLADLPASRFAETIKAIQLKPVK